MFETLFEKYPFFRKIPAVLCMAIIFKLSSMTTAELEGLPHVWDKLAHCLEYATLAGCFCMWWSRRAWQSKTVLKILAIVGLTLAYGCTDEYHQLFVEGRECSAMDLVADTVGGILGSAVYVLVCKILNRFDPLPAEKKTEDSEADPS